MIRVMVPVDALQRFHGHPEEAGRLPLVHPGLHQPGGAGMPKGMGRHPFQTRPRAGRGEPLLDVANDLPVQVHDGAIRNASLERVRKMGPKPPGNGDAGSPLVRDPAVKRLKVDPVVFEIDHVPAQGEDRALPLSRIEAQQDEEREVQPHLGLRQGGLEKAGRLCLGQPAGAPRRALWKLHRNRFRQQTLTVSVVDRCAQDAEVAPHRAGFELSERDELPAALPIHLLDRPAGEELREVADRVAHSDEVLVLILVGQCVGIEHVRYEDIRRIPRT